MDVTNGAAAPCPVRVHDLHVLNGTGDLPQAPKVKLLLLKRDVALRRYHAVSLPQLKQFHF